MDRSWLEQPLPTLAGKTPGGFMDTATGQQLVAGLLAQMHLHLHRNYWHSCPRHLLQRRTSTT
ncbi:MAG: MbcA/ParS/Xre antitoxin family protein [Rhodoferax sp.]|nr:MbcA/ParS/Xre antitoxin family protein [Rhodoferax sp.]